MSGLSECRVLVSGGTGFLARHIIQRLAAAGAEVRTSIRDASRGRQLAEDIGLSADGLQVFGCDLNHDERWRDAIEGCTHIIHCASPFPVSQPSNAADLVRPAVDGTKRILRFAHEAGVRRVVLTSSMNAIAGGKANDPDKIYTEADWTDLEGPMTPYDRSKTEAERAAWVFAKENPMLELAVINPGAIFGPLLGSHVSASGEIIRTMLQGRIPRVPRIGFGPIDVRDVADAHLAAMTAPDAVGRRFICSLDEVWLVDIARSLVASGAFKDFRIPTREMPDWLVKVGALVSPALRRASDHLGRRRRIDNGAIRELLCRDFIDLGSTVTAMAHDLRRYRMVEPSDR